jgi:ribonuclease BN (tRNA processing enzyme)
MTDLIFRAYAQTVNDFMRDMHLRNFTEEVNVTDITGVPTPTRDKNTAPWPDMAPLEICRFSDPWVRVRATLVNHGPVYPAFAFRFDTDDGSVVFSGDTGFPCRNLATMAKGADILVHEVIDPDFIYNQFANPTASEEAIIHHLLTAHTSIDDVGKVAEEAGVKTLVLNHLVPGNAPVAHLLRAKANFSGQLVIGEDLMQIGVGQRRVASLQSPAHIRPTP